MSTNVLSLEIASCLQQLDQTAIVSTTREELSYSKYCSVKTAGSKSSQSKFFAFLHQAAANWQLQHLSWQQELNHSCSQHWHFPQDASISMN